jgi:hypothetical protein
VSGYVMALLLYLSVTYNFGFASGVVWDGVVPGQLLAKVQRLDTNVHICSKSGSVIPIMETSTGRELTVCVNAAKSLYSVSSSTIKSIDKYSSLACPAPHFFPAFHTHT